MSDNMKLGLKDFKAAPVEDEKTMLGRHTIDPLAHAPNVTSRKELLRTLEEFEAAKSLQLADDPNNYMRNDPQPHVVTAYVLNQIISQFTPSVSIEELWKAVRKNAEDITFCIKRTDRTVGVGDGTQLLWVDATGVLQLSTQTIGDVHQPVFLRNGKLQTITGPVGSEETPVYIDETGTFQECKMSVFPVGSCFITAEQTNPNSMLGYGTWTLVAEVGHVGFIWRRDA